MPTYQTPPLGKWMFPEQIYRHNQKGFGWAGVGTSHKRSTPEEGSPAFYAEHERKVALDRLKNNHQKMLGMMGVRNTTERSQAFDRPAHLSQTRINGKFRDPAYDYSATAGGLRGGTQKFFYFEEGQKWLENWKNRRIAELNAIATDNFSAGPPQRIQVAPQYNDLDAILAKVLDQFEAGAFSTSLIDDMNKLQGAFLKIGATISDKKLAQYMRVLGDLKKQAQRITADPEEVVAQLDRGDEAADVADIARRTTAPAGRYTAGMFKIDTKDVKILRTVGLIADRLVRLLDEINSSINEDTPTRERKMEELGSRVLGSIAGQQSAFGEVGTFPRPGGDEARPTESRATIGFPSERTQRLPPQRPPADLETTAGMPPVKPF
jgi:hypothetical protein